LNTCKLLFIGNSLEVQVSPWNRNYGTFEGKYIDFLCDFLAKDKFELNIIQKNLEPEMGVISGLGKFFPVSGKDRKAERSDKSLHIKQRE